MLARVRIADDQNLLVLSIFIFVRNFTLLDQFEFLHESLATLTLASIVVELSSDWLWFSFALFFDYELTYGILFLALSRSLACQIAMAVSSCIQRLDWLYSEDVSKLAKIFECGLLFDVSWHYRHDALGGPADKSSLLLQDLEVDSVHIEVDISLLLRVRGGGRLIIIISASRGDLVV